MKAIKAWIAVDKNGKEFIYINEKPTKNLHYFTVPKDTTVAFSTKKISLTLTGKQMTFDDEPFELTISSAKSSNLEDLINRNYEATVRRGLITPRTMLKDFIAKMREEVTELEEAIDWFLVAGSMLTHYDLFSRLEEKVIINEKRAEMSLEQANQILIDHNKWRRNGSGEMENTLRLGMAIDIVTNHINSLHNGK